MLPGEKLKEIIEALFEPNSDFNRPEYVPTQDQIIEKRHYGTTVKQRTSASRTVVEELIKADRPFSQRLLNKRSFVEIGLGNDGAPTFIEMIESGKKHQYTVTGIDINPNYFPPGLENVCIQGDILEPNSQVTDALNSADVVRLSNLAVPYFVEQSTEAMQLLLGNLQESLKEGAYVIISHTHSHHMGYKGEEGFLLQVQEGRLIPLFFLYNVHLENNNIYYGGNTRFSIVNHLKQDLVLEAAYDDNDRSETLYDFFNDIDDVDLGSLQNEVDQAILEYNTRMTGGRSTKIGNMYAVPIDYVSALIERDLNLP